MEASPVVRASLIVLVGLVAACGKGGGKRHNAAAPAGDLLQVLVDGEEVAALTAEQLGARPRLVDLADDELPEIGEWTHLGARTADRRELSIRDPAETHAGLEVFLYLDDGRPAIGLFRTEPPGASPELAAELAKPRVGLVGITGVTVETRPPPAPPPAIVEVTIGGETQAVDLLVLPRRALDHDFGAGRKSRRPAWSLEAVLEVNSVAQVVAIGRSELVIEGDELRSPDVRVTIRKNRRGQLALDVWRRGQEGAVRGVRELRSLEVKTGR